MLVTLVSAERNRTLHNCYEGGLAGHVPLCVRLGVLGLLEM
jgi:hypothetical protein